MCRVLARGLDASFRQALCDGRGTEHAFGGEEPADLELPSMESLFGPDQAEEPETSLSREGSSTPSPEVESHPVSVSGISSVPAPPAPESVEHRNTGVLEKLLEERPAEAQRLIARLHRNLGHPSSQQLASQLQSRGASATLVNACKSYQCPLCAQLAPVHQAPKAAIKSATRFNERVLSDTFWITLPGGRTLPILSIMDAATRYMSARLLRTETSEQFLRAIERGWIRNFGPPECLQVDAHPSWGSAAVKDWSTEHGIELVVSPGEAHQRLSQIERRHQVLRRALDIFMSEHEGTTADHVKQALCYVVPQLNQNVTVRGFSPTQWVLGYQPRLPGLLLDEGLNPSHLDPSLDFRQKLDMRASAGKAILQADSDERLCRALLRQSHLSKAVFSVGHKVFYYREGSGVGPRVRWKGPATVTMVEPDRQGRQSVIWIVHGSQLIRAAPEHLRHDLFGNGASISPMDALDSVRGRGTTTFLDLSKTNRRLAARDVHMLDTDDEAEEPDSKVRRVDASFSEAGPSSAVAVPSAPGDSTLSLHEPPPSPISTLPLHPDLQFRPQ